MTEQPTPDETAAEETAAEETGPDETGPDETAPEEQVEAQHEATGVPAVDAAAARLAEIDAAALDEHVEIYEDVHRSLQEGLADLDEP